MKFTGNPGSILLRFLFLLHTEFFCFEVFAKVLKTLKYLNYLKTRLSIIFSVRFNLGLKLKENSTKRGRFGKDINF